MSTGPAIKTLYSRADKAFCRIDLMENGEVGKLFYLGDERIPEWKLVRFVGLPASILRDVLMKYVTFNPQSKFPATCLRCASANF